jgi:hypothetical protein
MQLAFKQQLARRLAGIDAEDSSGGDPEEAADGYFPGSLTQIEYNLIPR